MRKRPTGRTRTPPTSSNPATSLRRMMGKARRAASKTPGKKMPASRAMPVRMGPPTVPTNNRRTAAKTAPGQKESGEKGQQARKETVKSGAGDKGGEPSAANDGSNDSDAIERILKHREEQNKGAGGSSKSDKEQSEPSQQKQNSGEPQQPKSGQQAGKKSAQQDPSNKSKSQSQPGGEKANDPAASQKPSGDREQSANQQDDPRDGQQGESKQPDQQGKKSQQKSGQQQGQPKQQGPQVPARAAQAKPVTKSPRVNSSRAINPASRPAREVGSPPTRRIPPGNPPINRLAKLESKVVRATQSPARTTRPVRSWG